MKNLLIVVFLLIGSMNVQAEGLSILDAEAINFVDYDGEPVTYTGPRDTGFTGTVNALYDGNLTAVYLGQSSTHINRFRFEVFNSLNEWDAIGEEISTVVDAGALKFRFVDTDGVNESFINGLSRSFVIMDGFIPGDIDGIDYGPFDYILGLNDSSANDYDFDDFVVGLRFQPVSSVPVPAALPLMASALGLFSLHRRRQVKANLA
ncbi:MAG: VPLPA-CTERM sorting domain-containing protein [Pseudomonadota bacterium]